MKSDDSKIDENICEINDHEYLYNFPSLPSKSICKKCKTKWKLNYNTLEWEITDKFNEILGNDEELIRRWH